MTADSLVKELKRLAKNKEFKADHNLKSIMIDPYPDEECVDVIFKTKNFRWTATINYTLKDEMIKSDSDLFVGFGIDWSRWEEIYDYLCDDFENAWAFDGTFEMKGTRTEDIVRTLLEEMIHEFDEEDMIKRFKDLSKVIKNMENMDSEDMWIVSKIADKL